MEKWDAYNKDGEKVEGELIRGNPISEGLFHLVSEILVRHVDGDYLMMQRDFGKQSWGGFFEASAGGRVLKGETALEAAYRELFEETGINANNMSEIGRHIIGDTIFVNYETICDCAKDSVILQKGETISFKWMDKKDLIEFLKSDKCIPNHSSHLLEYLIK